MARSQPSPLSIDLSSLSSLILPALGGLLSRVGESTPLELKVSLEPSERVQQLEKQVAALQVELDELRKQHNRTEYLYSCEVVVNDRLVDWCRSQGLNPPKHMLHPEL